MTVRIDTVRLVAAFAAGCFVACAPAPDSSADAQEVTTSRRATEPADAGKEEPADAASPDAAPAVVECTAKFAKDVLPAFGEAGCAATQCHGTRFGRAIRIEVKDADLTYGELTTFKIAGKPYVTPGNNDPNASAIQCHLAGKCGVKMPPLGGTVPAALASVVERWLSCGAPNN